MRIRSIMLAGVSLVVAAATVALAADGQVMFRGTDSFGARQARDAAPVLAFAPATGLLLGGMASSEAATFTGPAEAFRLTASSGEIRICPASGQCGSWGTTGTVKDGDAVQARRAGPTAPGQTVQVEVTGLNLKATFDATAKSSAPSLGSFASKTVSPDVVAESALSTFTGWVQTRLTVSGGEARVCSSQGACGSWSASSDVKDGDQVQLRGTAGTFGTTKTVTASAGGATATFDVATRTKDTVPDAIAFGPAATGLEPGATASSTIVTLAGFDDAPISITGGEYALNGALWTTAAGTAKAGDKVQIRTTGGAFGETKTATLDVGGVKASFAATTRAKDVDPDPITFPAIADAAAGQSVSSAIVQVRSHDGISISVAGTGASYRICRDQTCASGSGWKTAQDTLQRDEWVQLMAPAPASGGVTATVATLSYGSRTATWSVSSKANAQCSGAFMRMTTPYGYVADICGWTRAPNLVKVVQKMSSTFVMVDLHARTACGTTAEAGLRQWNVGVSDTLTVTGFSQCNANYDFSQARSDWTNSAGVGLGVPYIVRSRGFLTSSFTFEEWQPSSITWEYRTSP